MVANHHIECFADGGYRSAETAELRAPLPRPQRRTTVDVQEARTISTVRWKIEAYFSRVKAFCVVSEFRGKGCSVHHYFFAGCRHGPIFRFVCCLVNLDLLERPLQQYEIGPDDATDDD